jgi:hypothetical protein
MVRKEIARPTRGLAMGRMTCAQAVSSQGAMRSNVPEGATARPKMIPSPERFRGVRSRVWSNLIAGLNALASPLRAIRQYKTIGPTGEACPPQAA